MPDVPQLVVGQRPFACRRRRSQRRHALPRQERRVDPAARLGEIQECADGAVQQGRHNRRPLALISNHPNPVPPRGRPQRPGAQRGRDIALDDPGDLGGMACSPMPRLGSLPLLKPLGRAFAGRCRVCHYRMGCPPLGGGIAPRVPCGKRGECSLARPLERHGRVSAELIPHALAGQPLSHMERWVARGAHPVQTSPRTCVSATSRRVGSGPQARRRASVRVGSGMAGDLYWRGDPGPHGGQKGRNAHISRVILVGYGIRYEADFIEILWCRRSELNRGPTDYESVALPLSYVGPRRPIAA